MEAPVTFQSNTPSLVLSFIPCRRRANEARPSAKQNPGDILKKFWKETSDIKNLGEICDNHNAVQTTYKCE